MSSYRRARMEGGTYFFTLVTYRRRAIFVDEPVIDVLRHVIKEVKQHYPFTINAWVLLPDHMHCIWTLPTGDADYSKRIGLIKSKFSSRVKAHYRNPNWLSQSKAKKREGTIWQRRFWEHQIRDEVDFKNHMDYVHYNPVKHGLVSQVVDWRYSTFHRHVDLGVYPRSWGGPCNVLAASFGE